MKKLFVILIALVMFSFVSSVSAQAICTPECPSGTTCMIAGGIAACNATNGALGAPTAQVTVNRAPGGASASGFCNGTSCNYIPLEQLPGQNVTTGGVSFGNYLQNIFRILIVLGGMFAVATFVFGGVTYMVSDVIDRKGWAKTQMTRAIYGILLLLGSYLLLTTINPDFRFSTFNPDALSAGGASSAAQSANNSNGTTPLSSTQAQQPLNVCQQMGQRMVLGPGGVGTQCAP